MAPPRGQRSGGEDGTGGSGGGGGGGSWVKKDRGADTTGEDVGDREIGTANRDRRDARGRGRGPREPRGEPRGTALRGEQLGTTEGRGRGRGRGGRSGGRGRTGLAVGAAPQDTGVHEDKDAGKDSTDEGEEQSGTMKATPLKVTRYTKGELLSIARLPTSNQKAVDLCPLIDKENKDSQLLIRITGGRQENGEPEEGSPEALAAARRERRERRAERKTLEQDDEERDDDADSPEVAQEEPAVSAVTAAPTVSAPSSPADNRGVVPTITSPAVPKSPVAATVVPPGIDEKPTGLADDDEADKAALRDAHKLVDRKKVDAAAGVAETLSVAASGKSTASAAGTQPGGTAS